MSESTYGASQRTSRSRSTRLEAMVRERAAAYRTSVPWRQARRFDLESRLSMSRLGERKAGRSTLPGDQAHRWVDPSNTEQGH